MYQKVSYVYYTNNNNLKFRIGRTSYIIVDREKSEIGRSVNGKISYAPKTLLKIK